MRGKIKWVLREGNCREWQKEKKEAVNKGQTKIIMREKKTTMKKLCRAWQGEKETMILRGIENKNMYSKYIKRKIEYWKEKMRIRGKRS